MGFWQEFGRRAAHLARREQFNRDLEDEIGFHIDARIDELENAGMPRVAAIAQARREFGSRIRTAEDSRAPWRFQWIEDLLTSLRHDVRASYRSPVFVLTGVICLALGIGANTLIFSLINATLLRPLAFENSERLVTISSVPLDRPDQRGGVNVPSYLAWKEQSRCFQFMGALYGT